MGKNKEQIRKNIEEADRFLDARAIDRYKMQKAQVHALVAIAMALQDILESEEDRPSQDR